MASPALAGERRPSPENAGGDPQQQRDGLHQALLQPRVVYLRDHVTAATIFPVPAAPLLARSLVLFLAHELNLEIERGDAFALEEAVPVDRFVDYWFGAFGAIMVLGKPEDLPPLSAEIDWSQICLGMFYIKPNYPGRSAHICTGGFLTTPVSRNQGCGRLMGETYIEYASKLSYTYSIFELVYETNVAAVKIWDSLGFKRIGVIKGAGRLRSYGAQVDAIMYGRDLQNDDDYVSEERFDKIRFYLEKGKYPPSADRSEKSRLRSAATHYKIVEGRLMLKDKEVISDGQKQYEIARSIHCLSHGGINKTTAHIAEKYHWVRIKETVSQVIRNCVECKEGTKAPVIKSEDFSAKSKSPPTGTSERRASQQKQTAARQSQQHQHQMQHRQQQLAPQPQQQIHLFSAHQHPEAARAAVVAAAASLDVPIDPAMMEDVQQHHHLQQQYAPVAAMMGPGAGGAAGHHHHHHQDVVATGGMSQQQHEDAVAAARAALNVDDDEQRQMLTDTNTLMERLVAEMKKEGYPTGDAKGGGDGSDGCHGMDGGD